LEKMVEVARWAPSGFHSQPWEFIIIQDPATKDQVVAAASASSPAPAVQDEADTSQAKRRPGFADAPVFILLAGDWRARIQFPNIPQPHRDRDEADIFLSGLASAFLYLHLAATSLGLASQWCSSAAHGRSGETVREILGLPEYIRTYDMMAVGYPAEPSIDKEVREVADMVHYYDGRPQDFRTPGKLEADRRRFTDWCGRAH
jgi:nicotinate-nucleotide--dimethylbenzimidazole phosphoribosyltransferase